MGFKDQTFCQDWCSNEECENNYIHTKDALEKNMLVCYFVDVPVDCTERKEKK